MKSTAAIPILDVMPDDYMDVSVTVVDGAIVEASHDDRVADIRVQHLPSGSYDVALLCTVEPSPSRSLAKATDATVEGMYCNFSTASLDPATRQYDHEVTVRVRATGGFRLDLRLAP